MIVNCKQKTNQSGRSMIEMIGVIAIIGVLTVGGLFGFSAAMEKHKFNQLKEQMHTISTNLITAFARVGNYSQLGYDPYSATKMAKDLGVFPENMIQSDGSIRHVYGGEVYVYAVSYAGTTASAFTIDFQDLPKKVSIQLAIDGTFTENSTVMNIELMGNSSMQPNQGVLGILQ